MSVHTTEITSDHIPSDNPIHQRLLKAYHLAAPFVSGDTLELGCGEGRGVQIISKKATSYTGLDKISEVINRLEEENPELAFETSTFPPLDFPDESFDTIVSLQVIEHIRNDELFLSEISRVLRPGGKAILTTPNSKMTLSRNPWHIREYTADALATLGKKHFKQVEMKGVAGSEKVLTYHTQNKQSVDRLMKWDILDLQHRLPAWTLRKPYEILNRRNRNKLQDGNNNLVLSISQEDYFLKEQSEQNLDLFCLLHK